MSRKTKSPVNRDETLDRLELRVGRVLDVVPEPSAPKPSYLLQIDFGTCRKQSVGRFTKHSADDLQGQLVVGALNFGVVTIGEQPSEVLVLGVQYPKAESGEATFLKPAAESVAIASRVGGDQGAEPLPLVAKHDTFDRLEIRLGRVMEVEPLKATAGHCRLLLDYGKFGRRPCVAALGECSATKGQLLLGVLNLEPGAGEDIDSGAELLLVPDGRGAMTYLTPANDLAKIGGKLF